MPTAPWTAINNTPNKSIRQDVARRGACLHHAAMTSLDGLRRLEMGAKQVSSTAIIKDHNIERMMPDEAFRAWSLSSAFWDSALRSIEACNESVIGWTVSDETHWAMAKAVAYWSEIEGWWPHRDGPRNTWTVITHSEVYTIHGASYATACAGGVNADLVTSRAQMLRGGGAAPAGIPMAPSSSVSAVPRYNVPTAVNFAYGLTKAAQLAMQQALTRLKRYTGLQDGDFGSMSVISMQQWLKDSGYLPAGYLVDGKPGGVYGEALHDLADKYGYTGSHIGLPGANVSAALEKWAASMAPVLAAPKQASPYSVGPVIRSGSDWSISLPQGELAKRICRELIKKGRLPANYNNDGNPQRAFEAAVQETLNVSKVFTGANDGKLERGGAFGVQDYGNRFASYIARGGLRDGRLGVFSWLCFAEGLVG